MIRAKRKEATNGSEVAEEYRHAPKKLKLIIRERSIYSVLDELEKAGDISTALTLLFEISTFYPLKSKDAELTFQRLLQYFRMVTPTSVQRSGGGQSTTTTTTSAEMTGDSAWLDVKLKMIEILRHISKSGWLSASTSHGGGGVILSATGSITPSSSAVAPPDSPDGLMHSILDHISDEGNEPECVAALMSLVQDFHRYVSCESPAFKRMLKDCSQALTDRLWSVRVASIRLLTKAVLRQRQLRRENLLSSPSNETNILSADDLESILAKFTDDSDGRVRSAAAESLLDVCTHNFALPRQHYELVCRLTKDAAESVRLLGLRLIHVYAATPAYVDTLIAAQGANKDVEIRLVDHAFSELCHGMNDLSVTVRTEAANLLGTMKEVNEKFLEQTLDKKLMSQMRFTKTSFFAIRGGKQQQHQHHSSEWATGRKFGADAPMEKVEEDSQSMIPSGACGAFVTGLEDEYLSVRNASIDAISNLAATCPSPAFAQNALDFLADMFNDEIDEVRLNAIKSLRRLCGHIVLNVDQMEVILSALDDASPDSREALRELLCVCTMADVPCLRMTVEALLNNLKRYSGDRQSIWRCMKCLGTNHAALGIPLVADLLDLHPFFETTEPPLEDPFYVAKLILVLNVAAKCPPVKALFVGHTSRHYHYLRSSNPHLVPNLDLVAETSSIALEKASDDFGSLDETLGRCQKLLAAAMHLSGAMKWELTKLVIEDLKRLVESITGMVDEDSSDDSVSHVRATNARWRAECLRFCAENVTRLEQLLGQLANDEHLYAKSSSNASSSLVGELKSILKSSFGFEHLWTSGGDTSMTIEEDKCGLVALACSMRLRTIAALMALNAEDDGGQEGGGGRRWLSMFLITFERMIKYFANEPWIADLTGLTEELGDDNSAIKAREILQRLANVPLNAALDEVEFAKSTIRRKRATIVEPDKNNDMIVRFVSGLAASIKMTATFYDLDDADLANVRIRIVYPDQREQFVKPRLSHFRRLSPSVCRLRTEVLVSDYSWTDAARIDLSLIYRLSAETVNGGEQYENENDALSWMNLDEAKRKGVSVKLYPKSRC